MLDVTWRKERFKKSVQNWPKEHEGKLPTACEKRRSRKLEFRFSHVNITTRLYTGCTLQNYAVSKVNTKFISHLTRAQRTPSAGQLSKFLMRYQQFASHAYCGAAGPVSKMASQQEKAFCVLRFEVSRSVITVQSEFRARFIKDATCVFSKP